MGSPTADEINPAITLRTLSYGDYGMLLIMGNAGFISWTVDRSTISCEAGFRSIGFLKQACSDGFLEHSREVDDLMSPSRI